MSECRVVMGGLQWQGQQKWSSRCSVHGSCMACVLTKNAASTLDNFKAEMCPAARERSLIVKHGHAMVTAWYQHKDISTECFEKLTYDCDVT
jgi:hypothetical protein